MKILAEGHVYELCSFEGTNDQRLEFIRKEKNPETGSLDTIADGTTNEEVLSVLINRMGMLQSKSPCRENALVITKLQEALMWLEYRTADREVRGVEGTPEK